MGALIHGIYNQSHRFNLANILYKSFSKDIKNSLLSPPGFEKILYMSYYPLDIVMASVSFPLMGWSYYFNNQLAIQDYISILWGKN